MIRQFVRLAVAAVALGALPLPTAAEFLSPDWSKFSVEGVAAPDWIAGENDGAFIGMCTGCAGLLMLQVQTQPDDGTGARVQSGATTAQSYTEIGEANAAKLGGSAAYYGTDEVEFASARGFKTKARGATGDYSATYQLWDDGQQLIVRVFGSDQGEVDALAEKVFAAAAPATFN